jgi:enolase
MKIAHIKARQILDSRGEPTVEVLCALENGVEGRASVPSGASTGSHEAVELRDGGGEYGGKGVLNAVQNIEGEIARHLESIETDSQSVVDQALIDIDGTQNKSRLGANALLGVSLAFARACSNAQHIEPYEYIANISKNTDVKIPQPMFNVINGGKHADSGLDIQEFMLAPIGFDSIHRKIQAGAEIIKSLQTLLGECGYATSVGDEGGFAPKLSSNEEAFDFIEKAITHSGYSFDEVKIGIDVAASSFYEKEKYHLKIAGSKKELDSGEIVSWYEELALKYPIISIEDGLHEDDWEGFSHMRDRLGDKMLIVGDDLTVTNTERIMEAIEKKAVTSVLIKPNQIGTLSETIRAVEMIKKNGLVPFASHRSGETTDTFIADIAVGLSCDFIKSGSLRRGERVCKYNRLMEIEDALG